MFSINAIDPVTNLDASHGSPRNHSHPFRHHLTLISVALKRCPDMALVDFYQLAVLYNLSRDAGVLSNRSHSPPMSAPSSPPSSPVDSGQTDSFLFPPIQSGLKTPERKPDATPSVPDPTPLALGSSILHKLQPDTDQAPKHHLTKYEQYIIQDFQRHRVFVDIEVFMKRVLHVPEDWRKLWGPTINQIKLSGPFSTAHSKYTRKCETHGILERKFYKPLADIGNAILDFSKSSEDDLVKPRTPQRYLVNDPLGIHCGVMNDLKPDVVAVHSGFLPNILSEERKKRRLRESNLTWAQPLQVLEVKPWDNALVDGSCMPRLKVDGEPEISFRDNLV